MSVECFLVAATGRANLSLRRYVTESKCSIEGNIGIHEARLPLGEIPMGTAEDHTWQPELPEVADDDPRWPTHCACGHAFAEDDRRQRFTEALFVGPDGREHEIQHLPPGAIYDAAWMCGYGQVNGDGPAWAITLPNGSVWHPGMEATNCTRKGQDHDCWCVHGEAPVLTVDKQPVPGRSTCQAGAGSINSREGTPKHWHGFLRDGSLVVA